MLRKRVVVTGMGIVAPTGNNVQEAWENTVAGKSGIDFISLFDTSRIQNKIGGEVRGVDFKQLIGHKATRRLDRFVQLSLVAASEAMQDSHLTITDDNRYEVGCIVGSGIGGISTLINTTLNFDKHGQRGVSPTFVPGVLMDGSPSQIAITYGIRGPNYSITTACATGNNCIGEAVEKIRQGKTMAMLAGSAEASNNAVCISGFDNMTALTNNQTDPQRASCPFDRNRSGFVMSEGAGILVLEELNHALERDANIYAEILGYGHTADAYHATAPMENGDGAAEAIRQALKDAELSSQDIDYINAHGTSTVLNDIAETKAIKTVFGKNAYTIPISSTKSVTGHMLGAAGSVEAIFTIMALRDNMIPPTINYDTPDPACDLNYTPNVCEKRDIHLAMTNSFGFGGHNAVLIIGEYPR